MVLYLATEVVLIIKVKRNVSVKGQKIVSSVLMLSSTTDQEMIKLFRV